WSKRSAKARARPRRNSRVPFGFRRKKKPVVLPLPPEPEEEDLEPFEVEGAEFDGLTEEWRLVGVMNVKGRLSDALNRREAIRIRDVRWAPIDGSADFEAVPGLKSVDPYDLIVVLAGEGRLPPMSEEEEAAHKVH